MCVVPGLNNRRFFEQIGFQVKFSVEMNEPKMRSICPACLAQEGREQKSRLGTKNSGLRIFPSVKGRLARSISRHFS